MAVLALITFLFPMDTSRAGFAITVVLAFAIFQTLVVTALPKTSAQIPLITYIVTQMSIGGFITLYSILITWLVNTFATGNRPLPGFLSCFICSSPSQPYRGRTHGQIASLSKTSENPELTQASMMITSEIEKKKVRAQYKEQWVRFFNALDIVVMVLCAAISIIFPILIFATTLFQTASDPASSSSALPANYSSKFQDVTQSPMTNQNSSIGSNIGGNSQIGSGTGGGQMGGGGP